MDFPCGDPKKCNCYAVFDMKGWNSHFFNGTYQLWKTCRFHDKGKYINVTSGPQFSRGGGMFLTQLLMTCLKVSERNIFLGLIFKQNPFSQNSTPKVMLSTYPQSLS